MAATYAIAAETDDGHSMGSATPGNWGTMGTASSATTAGNLIVQKSTDGGSNHTCYVGHFRWDTSPTPDTDVVSGVVFRFWPTAITNATNYTLGFVWNEPGTIGTEDWVKAGTATHGSIAMSAIVVGAWNSVTISSPATLNKTGFSGLRLTISGSAVVTPVGINSVTISGFAGGHPAELVVTSAALSTPLANSTFLVL